VSAVANSRSFRAAREAEWLHLDALITTCEKKSPAALSDEDLMALPILYRSALSSLSVARETSLDLELVTFLESLCARAYFFIYGVRTSPARRIAAFFAKDWPEAVRKLWRETLLSALLILIGVLTAYMLVGADPSWYGSFVPDDYAGGRTFSSDAASLRATLYDSPDGRSGLAIFATFLFTNNSQVAIRCFAFGFMFGLPTIFLLVYQGAIAGAMGALFASHDLGFELGGWLIIHGSTELLAIIIAGAAGLRIGWSVVFPGEASRLAAAAAAGKTAGLAMAGVVIMLLVAGLLEGFARQLITVDIARYAIGGLMLTMWLAYFYVPRRGGIAAS
jgi:uncharacterized membrane protein SpoIIM required for sporulation